jgi:hypothetical protein
MPSQWSSKTAEKRVSMRELRATVLHPLEFNHEKSIFRHWEAKPTCSVKPF